MSTRTNTGHDTLLYRWGFVALDANIEPANRFLKTMASLGWPSFDVSGLRIHHHPEARLERYSLPDATILIIGHAFAVDGSSVEDCVARVGHADGESLDLLALALSGRFALIAAGDFGARIYHDPAGSRTIYYRASGGFAAASHAELLATAVGAELNPEIAHFTQSKGYRGMSTRYLPGDLTPYKSIFQLVPNNALDSNGKTHRYWPTEPLRSQTSQDFQRAIDDYLNKFVRFVSGRWLPLVGITGGIDSRTLVSAFAAAEVPFESFTWRARANLRKAECRLVDRQIAGLGAPHRYVWLDLRGMPELGRAANANSTRTGAGGGRPQAIAGAYPGGRHNGRELAFVLGWGAEALRGYYNLKEGEMADYSAEQMARAYWIKVEDPEGGATAWKLVLKAFEDFRKRANYEDLEGLGYDPNDIFYLEHRMGTWCGISLNELDVATVSLVGFNSRSVLLAAWGLPRRRRLSKQLLLDVVARHHAALGNVPVIGLKDTPEPGHRRKKPRKARRRPKTQPAAPEAQLTGPLDRAWERLRRLLRRGT